MTRTKPWRVLAPLLAILLTGCSATTPACPDRSAPLLPPPAVLMQPAESPQTGARLRQLLPPTSRHVVGTPSG